MRGALPVKTSPWPEFVCPNHHCPLSVERDALLCPEGERYPIMDGIPRFVTSENYAVAFGLEWTRFQKTQLDSYTGATISRDRARRCLGEVLWDGLAERQVLECGCGAGRFTEILLERGACVTSIDLSAAVDANRRNFPQNEHHRIAQTDIVAPPFAARRFDVVFCLGVIQHTPNTERTIAALYEQVKPGGWVVIDHYGPYPTWYFRSAALLRQIFLRLPPDRAMGYTERIVDLFLPLHRRWSHLTVPRKLLKIVSPVQAYYATFPQLDQQLQREWAVLDTYDMLTDRYKRFRSRKRIHRTLERLGLEELWCETGGNGVEARGKRPVTARNP